MADALHQKRRWILLLPICLHGLVLACGGVAATTWGAHQILRPTSEINRLRREPSSAETARGEVWFNGMIEGFGAIAGRDGRVPERDPWNGCALHRQVYRSGKNAGFYDDGSGWSWGKAIVTGGSHRVEARLDQISGGARTVLDPKVAEIMLPGEQMGGNVRYVQECFTRGQPVTIDGRIDPVTGLVASVPERALGLIETKSGLDKRLLTSTALAAISWLALGAPLAWIVVLIAFLRSPATLARTIDGLLGRTTRGWLSGAATSGALGAGIGVLVALLLARSAFVPIAFFATFAVVGAVLGAARDRLASLHLAEELFEGKGVNGFTCSSGILENPETPAKTGLQYGSFAFAVGEVFVLGPKSAVGEKLVTAPSHPSLSAKEERGRFTVDAATATYFGRFEQKAMPGSAISDLGVTSEKLAAGGRYWLKETVLPPDSPLTVLGRSESIVDPFTETEDYRAHAEAKHYVGTKGNETAVIGSSREELVAQLNRDRSTLHFVLGALALWVVAPVLTIATLVRYAH